MATAPPCWNCSGTTFLSGGRDELRRPITVCATCKEWQEDEPDPYLL